jgi:hypothetical protein
MEIIHTEKTYSNDCTSTGFKIEVRDNDTMRVTSHSRWQGSRTDEVWIVKTPLSVIAAIKNEADPEEPDIQTALLTWAETDWQATAKKIRSGYLI